MIRRLVLALEAIAAELKRQNDASDRGSEDTTIFQALIRKAQQQNEQMLRLQRELVEAKRRTEDMGDSVSH